ncbi:GyrI-like domain-containing protein [Neobacillus sp. PS3-40]|uniref:GyrI-like domain-containing protein n=1 Tax=Neobacillus sp. PS3-40 TaxID=3070679 RepID=UPI0027E0113B|nr:GyrI-like domain-containing protein [Neobacillus sp. PS3-40]WML44196.1 GyrI-like domain-containing protein [Neobacillus sp. PS3-40]
MKFKIIERNHFQVVGIKRQVSCVNGENHALIPKIWDEVNKDGTDDLLFKLNNGQIKGVLGICVETNSKQVIDYWVATEFDGDTPEELLELEIPKSKWAIFEVHGPMPNAMQNAWKQIFSEWFPSSDYQHTGAPNLEVYPEENPYRPNYYSEIWIPVD